MVRLAGVHAVRPTGDVDDGVRQCLVHRDVGIAEPPDAFLVAERLAQRLTEHDRGVLDGVVPFDLDVAFGAHGQVEAGVGAQCGEHVVVERDTGVDVHLPGAFEVELDDDLGFFGSALDACATAGSHEAPNGWANSVAANFALADRNASFSAASPIVVRRCPEMPTSRIRTPASR